MGSLGFIPMTSIKAYCDLFGIEDEDERDEFVNFIRVLDEEYLTLQAQKPAEDAGKGDKPNTPKAGKERMK